MTIHVQHVSPPEIKRKPFFYDRQIARYLVQFLALFTGYQVVTGNQRDGKRHFIDVPCMFGDYGYAVDYIIGGGTDNVLPALPIMSLYMTGLKQKDDWRLNPQYFERFRYTERARDGDGNLLVNQPGVHKTIERYMPVPYDMNFELTIWASNNDQGFQLLEQIMTVFNPDMDVQLSNSPADWIFIARVLFGGDVKLEKAVPNGAANPDPLYTYSLSFTTTIFLSPPAKVYDDNPIYSIHVPIVDLEACLDFDAMPQLDGLIVAATPQEIADHEIS